MADPIRSLGPQTAAWVQKVQLEGEIKRLVDRFQNQTGLRVSEINLVDTGWFAGEPEASQVSLEVEEQ